MRVFRLMRHYEKWAVSDLENAAVRTTTQKKQLHLPVQRTETTV